MKSLLDKLGYKPGVEALAWRVPEALVADFATLNSGDDPCFRIAFVHHRSELAEAAAEVASRYRPGGHLWLAYPKKSGAIRSDITRDHGWDLVTALGLLAVTQVAIDENWSALRFRLRDEIKILRRRSER